MCIISLMPYHSKGIDRKAIRKERMKPFPLMNKTIERDEVLQPCLKLCKKLEFAGIILEYRRLDVFDKTHIDGSPDIEIKLPHEDIVFLLMAECKNKDGGIQSDVQKEYEEKYKPYKNVQYELITSHEQLEYIIRKISKVKVDMSGFLDFECEPENKPGSDI